jgi:hypothetical protein
LQINRFLPLVDSYDRGDHLNAASHGSSRSLAGSSTHNSFTQCNNGIATPTSAIPPVAPKLAPAGAAWAECEPPSGVLINMRFAPTVREELVSELQDAWTALRPLKQLPTSFLLPEHACMT